MTFTVRGQRITVERGTGASADAYLYIQIDGREFWLGHWRPGLTRGDVRREVARFAREHPGHFNLRREPAAGSA